MGRQDLIEVTLRRIDFSLDDAYETFLLGQGDKALSKYRDILGLLESLGDGLPGKITEQLDRKKLIALTNMGDILLEAGRVDEAEKTFSSTFSKLEESQLMEMPAMSPTHLRLAEIYRKQGAFKQALEHAKKSLNLAEEHSNPLALTLSCSMIGGIAHQMGQLKEALRYYEKAYNCLKKPAIMRESLEKIKLFLNLGRLFREMNDEKKSGVLFQEGFNLALQEANAFSVKYNSLQVLHFINLGKNFFELVIPSDSNNKKKLELLLVAGDLLNIKGRWDFSINNYFSAEELLNALETASRTLSARCSNGIGNVFTARKDYKNAVERLQKAHDLAMGGDDVQWSAETAINLGTALSKSGADSEGMKYYDKAIDFLNDLKECKLQLELMVKVQNQIGFIRIKDRDYGPARELLEANIDLLKQNPMSSNRGEAFQILGQLKSEMNDFNSAEKDLFSALDIYQRNEVILQIAQTYKQLGLNAVSKAEYEDAHYFFDEAIEILRKLDVIQELPILMTQKGKVALLEERYKDAEKIFKDELDASERSGNKHMLAFSNYHLGQLYRMENKEYLAEKYLTQSLQLYRDVGNRVFEALTHLEFALFYKDKSIFRRALEHADNAEELLKKSNNLSHQGQMAFTRALIYGEIKGKQQDAEHWFDKAVTTLKATGSLSLELAEAYYEFGNYWYKHANKEKALESFREAINTSEMLGIRLKTKKYMDRVAEIDANEAVRIKMQGFMSKEVAQKVGKDDTGMITIKRQSISVLFADIRGFTGITETLELSELQELMNDFYQTCCKAILRNHGMVNKFIGDNVMALFNINGDNDEHPFWGVKAGMEMLEELRKINRRRDKVNKVPIRVGIGVNSGQVLLGSFGSVIRQDFTAIGDNVNVAARLQAQSKGDELIISESTYETLQDRFEAEDLGSVSVKGRKQPVKLWKIVKEK